MLNFSDAECKVEDVSILLYSGFCTALNRSTSSSADKKAESVTL